MAALLPRDSCPTLWLRDHLTTERLGSPLSPASLLHPLHNFFLVASLQTETHVLQRSRAAT